MLGALEPPFCTLSIKQQQIVQHVQRHIYLTLNVTVETPSLPSPQTSRLQLVPLPFVVTTS